MCVFTLKKIDSIVGMIDFYKIEIGCKCPFDIFVESLKKDKNKLLQFGKIMHRMERFANKSSRTKKHINTIRGLNIEGVIVKEFKEKQIRVYFFQMENVYNTAYIVLGALTKDKQHKDIKKVKKIIKDYLRSKGNE